MHLVRENILNVTLLAIMTLVSSCGVLKKNVRPSASLNHGLIAYYRCNGNVKDESGRSNDAVNHNVTFTADRFNRVNSACEFNGSNSFLEIAHKAYLNIGVNGSLSFWLKYYGGSSILLWKRKYSGSKGWEVYFGWPNELLVYTNEDAAYIKTGSIHAGNKWYHVVINDEYGNVSVYVDGKKVAENALGGFESTGENLLIGRDEIGNYFTGCLDDLRIYNRPLSEEEIRALYHMRQECK